MFDYLAQEKLQAQLSILTERADVYRKTSPSYLQIDSLVLVHTLLGLVSPRKVSINLFYRDTPGIKSTVHLIEVLLPGLQQPLFEGPVTPRILIWNSYNGECALSIRVGLYREQSSIPVTVSPDFFSYKVLSIRDTDCMETVLNDFAKGITSALSHVQTHMSSDFLRLMENKIPMSKISSVLAALVQDGTISASLSNVAEKQIYYQQAGESISVWNFFNLLGIGVKENSVCQVAYEKKNSKLMSKVLATV